MDGSLIRAWWSRASFAALASVIALQAQIAVGQDPATEETTAANANAERDLDAPWETFRPSGMDASFEMPKKPKHKQRSFTPVADEPAIKVNLHSAVVQNGAIMFSAGWHDLHTIPRNSRQQQDVLKGAISTSVANVMGAVAESKKIRLERYPGRQISYRFAAGKEVYRATEQVYLVGARQYQFRLLAEMDKFDETVADRFFKSVKLLDPDNDLPPRPRKKKR